VPDGAGPELARRRAGTLHVVREHGRVQPVDGVVGDPYRVTLVVGGDHAENRPEDLFATDRRAVVDVAEDRRLHVVPALEVLGAPAAGRERCPFGHALADVALDTIALAFGDQRAQLRLLVERIAHPRLREHRRQRLDQIVVAALRHDDPRERRAHLPVERAFSPGDRLGRGVQLHVVEDHRRRFPAELERAPRDALAAQ
jgi:hypothetical protein